MSCNHTMYRIPISKFYRDSFVPKTFKGYSSKNGAFFVSTKDTERFEYLISCLHKLPERIFQDCLDNIKEIPCGQCNYCRMQNSKEWAMRCVAESTLHEHNYFITLTYDNEHLPKPFYTYNRNDFEFGLYSPLVYKDFELFKKKLLRYFDYHFSHQGIRFLMCGEYGPKTSRPHFHAIFFNLPLPDLKKVSSYSLGGNNITYLTSNIVESCWSKGFVTIGEVNWDTCSYVSRYVLKKFVGKQEDDYQALCKLNDKIPLPPEFRKSSRNPGLARPFYEDNKDAIYKHDKVVLPNGKIAKPGTYFDYLYELEEPEKLQEIKEQRHKNQIIKLNNKYKNMSSAQIFEIKDKEEEQFNRRISKLKRNI